MHADDGLITGVEMGFGDFIVETETIQRKPVTPTPGPTCAVATDFTLKGRPASALPGGPTKLDDLAGTFGSKKGFFKTGGISDIKSYLLKQGNGATGVVFGSRGPGRTGHFFNAQNQNGKIRFLDGQTGRSANLDGYRSFQFMNTTVL